MSKIITFSKYFPSYHEKAGQTTCFIQKILNQIGVDVDEKEYLDKLLSLNNESLSNDKLVYTDIFLFWKTLTVRNIKTDKKHTIRAGKRFKAKELFSPRVWSKKPYNSPQIIFWDDVLIEKVISFEISEDRGRTFVYGDKQVMPIQRSMIAMNDGLTLNDFDNWFKHPKPFSGQIICWDKDLDY